MRSLEHVRIPDSAVSNEKAYRSGLARFGLGSAQMFTAAFALVLLLLTGVNRWSLLAATLASVLTTISVLLYRRN